MHCILSKEVNNSLNFLNSKNRWGRKVKFIINSFIRVILHMLQRDLNRSQKKKPKNLKGWISCRVWFIICEIDRLEASKIREKWPCNGCLSFFLRLMIFFSRRNGFGHDLCSCPFVLILLIPCYFFFKKRYSR